MTKNNQGRCKIAILGATGHIAKGLIADFYNDPQFELFLFARSMDKLTHFLDENGMSCGVRCIPIPIDTIEGKYDALINCTGVGNLAGLETAADNIFLLTEMFDNMIIKYLKANREAVYINMSSGAVCGDDFSSPAREDSRNMINVSDIDRKTYYSIAKLNSEAKHRSLKDLMITDLRVFSYFSRFIDMGSKFLVTEIIRSIKDKAVFKTNSVNIKRDYIGHKDLGSLVRKCFSNARNDSFDVYSQAPVSKTEMLEAYKNEFGLKYEVVDDLELLNPTGIKPMYYSEDRKALSIGFEPKYSSVETLIGETKYILRGGEKQ